MITTQVTDGWTNGLPVVYQERKHQSREHADAYAQELIQRRAKVSITIFDDGQPVDFIQGSDK
ncbi:MAG: hypothetical protein KGL39_58195 [Patescibacteria group bacterium]|nr:hypothetical protein [Patescibacteria group bacterium]